MTNTQNSSHTHVTVDGDGVAVLEIRNAGVLNILSSPVARDVAATITSLGELDEVRALVLRGSGDRSFIGGADLTEMVDLDAATAREFITHIGALCDAVRDFPAPVIARLAGWSLGAGLEVAVACDIRIAAADAHFGMPEVAVGIPSVVHAALLPRLIGQGRAQWLLLTAKNIDAATALAWGLVDEVCSPSELDAATDSAARGLVGLGAAAVRQQKRLLRSWEHLSIDQAVEASIAEFGDAFDTGEPQRFMGEFVNRKKRRDPAAAR